MSAQSSPSATTICPINPDKVINQGVVNNEVIYGAQRILSYDATFYPSRAIDGNYDADFAAAVKAYESRFGLGDGNGSTLRIGDFFPCFTLELPAVSNLYLNRLVSPGEVINIDFTVNTEFQRNGLNPLSALFERVSFRVEDINNYSIPDAANDKLFISTSAGRSGAVNWTLPSSFTTTDNDYNAVVDLLTFGPGISSFYSPGKLIVKGSFSINFGFEPVSGPVTGGNRPLQVKALIEGPQDDLGRVIAGGERLLGRFSFTNPNHNSVAIVTLKVGACTPNGPSPCSYGTTRLLEEVRDIRLYDSSGKRLVEGTPIESGFDAGRVKFKRGTGLFIIPGNDSKVIEVRALLAEITGVTGGAETGVPIEAYISDEDFRATSGSFNLTNLAGAPAIALAKALSKSEPTVTVSKPAISNVSVGENELLQFTVSADVAGDVEWSKIEFVTDVADADFTPGALTLRYQGNDLDLKTKAHPVNGGEGVIVLSVPERITAASSKTYSLYADVSKVTDNTSATVTTKLKLDEQGFFQPSTRARAESLGSNSFVWSDLGISPHSESSLDWHNGFRIVTLPSQSVALIEGGVGGLALVPTADLKINGSDGPASISEEDPLVISWSAFPKDSFNECRIIFRGEGFADAVHDVDASGIFDLSGTEARKQNSQYIFECASLAGEFIADSVSVDFISSSPTPTPTLTPPVDRDGEFFIFVNTRSSFSSLEGFDDSGFVAACHRISTD